MDDSKRDRFHDRLRQAPGRYSVPGSLPVLFFGNLPAAQIATVGLNPSRREFMDAHGRELEGAQRRFETLGSLGASDRSTLTPEQCDDAVATMRAYYEPGKPVYGWFRSLAWVIRGMGFEYASGEVAHLDLVQEATDPTWSALQTNDAAAATALRAQDAPFLRWELEAFPIRVLVCNGRSVLDEMKRLVDARTVASGTMARLNWEVATADIAGRTMAVVGWNIPLARPTGLTAEGHDELGKLFAAQLAELRVL